MLEEKIIDLREKLENSIEKEENYDKIYKLSIELDELIEEYYKLELRNFIRV